MNIIKKTIGLFLCLCTCVFSTSFAQELGKKSLIQFTKEHAIYTYSYGSGDIILFYPRRGLDSEFSLQGTSAKYLSGRKEDCVAINGLYFGKGIDGARFQPAGPLYQYVGLGKDPIIIHSDTRPEDDVNLRQHIFYNSLNNNISINKAITIAKGVSFFAGPLMIDQGVLNSSLTSKISHRSGKHYRTFVIQDHKNKAIRGISTQKTTLTDLASALQTLFHNKNITVVNLDGGSSSSFASSKLSYNASKLLPSFFHSCK